MSEHNPMRGPLVIDWNGGMAPRLMGVDHLGRSREVALVTFYNGSDDPHVHDNARLLKAVWNSYDKHCGENSLDCAVADLFGEALRLLKQVREACLYPEDDGRVGVTTEPTVDEKLFADICKVLSHIKE